MFAGIHPARPLVGDNESRRRAAARGSGMALHFHAHQQCEHLTATMAATAFPRGLPLAPALFAPGALVWGVGTLPDCVCLLQTGRVDIVGLDPAGNELLLRTVRAGEIFGEVCFCRYRAEPHHFLARAAARSAVVQLSYDHFQQSLRSDSSFLESVLHEFCGRLSEHEERIQILALHEAPQRLRRLLLHLARTRGIPSTIRPGDSRLTLSHAELAALCALSRPHVSLLMTQFRDRGWVSYQRGGPLHVHTAALLAAEPLP